MTNYRLSALSTKIERTLSDDIRIVWIVGAIDFFLLFLSITVWGFFELPWYTSVILLFLFLGLWPYKRNKYGDYMTLKLLNLVQFNAFMGINIKDDVYE